VRNTFEGLFERFSAALIERYNIHIRRCRCSELSHLLATINGAFQSRPKTIVPPGAKNGVRHAVHHDASGARPGRRKPEKQDREPQRTQRPQRTARNEKQLDEAPSYTTCRFRER
jgi:hypothetical protein